MAKAGEKLKVARTSSTREDAQNQKLLSTFLDLKTQFHPVFRHYFTEKHKVPLAWYDMRLKYARSAATTSIVGHIVGLGDRHLSNILIHKTTGEVVHIDLGIAFDQASNFRSDKSIMLTSRLFIGTLTANTGACPLPLNG